MVTNITIEANRSQPQLPEQSPPHRAPTSHHPHCSSLPPCQVGMSYMVSLVGDFNVVAYLEVNILFIMVIGNLVSLVYLIEYI